MPLRKLSEGQNFNELRKTSELLYFQTLNAILDGLFLNF